MSNKLLGTLFRREGLTAQPAQSRADRREKILGERGRIFSSPWVETPIRAIALDSTRRGAQHQRASRASRPNLDTAGQNVTEGLNGFRGENVLAEQAQDRGTARTRFHENAARFRALTFARNERQNRNYPSAKLNDL